MSTVPRPQTSTFRHSARSSRAGLVPFCSSYFPHPPVQGLFFQSPNRMPRPAPHPPSRARSRTGKQRQASQKAGGGAAAIHPHERGQNQAGDRQHRPTCQMRHRHQARINGQSKSQDKRRNPPKRARRNQAARTRAQPASAGQKRARKFVAPKI